MKPILAFMLLFLVAAGSPGCSLFAPDTTPRSGVSVVQMEAGGYGKGLFKVTPYEYDECRVAVGEQDVSCQSEYLVSCDIGRPESEPFCGLTREAGPDRVSAYPAEGRP